MRATPSAIKDKAVREMILEIERKGLAHYNELFPKREVRNVDSTSVFILGIADILAEMREAKK